MAQDTQPDWSRSGPPKDKVFGKQALANLIYDIELPITKSDLLAKIGNESFMVNKSGTTLTVKEALQDCPYDEFFTVAAITSCPEVENKLEALKAA